MERIILGIDPGTIVMGFAVLKQEKGKLTSILLYSLELKKIEDYILKLKKIHDKTIEIIDQYHPDEIAIESPFLGENAQSMLKLGRAQGVAISSGLSRNIPISEYSPKKVKMAVTGNGNASKEQVLKTVRDILSLKEISDKHYDSSDAMAVALCHHFNKSNLSGEKKYSSWTSFVNNNKKKII